MDVQIFFPAVFSSKNGRSFPPLESKILHFASQKNKNKNIPPFFKINRYAMLRETMMWSTHLEQLIPRDLVVSVQVVKTESNWAEPQQKNQKKVISDSCRLRENQNVPLMCTHTTACWSCCWAARWCWCSCSSRCPRWAESVPACAWSLGSSPGPPWPHFQIKKSVAIHHAVVEGGNIFESEFLFQKGRRIRRRQPKRPIW